MNKQTVLCGIMFLAFNTNLFAEQSHTPPQQIQCKSTDSRLNCTLPNDFGTYFFIASWAGNVKGTQTYYFTSGKTLGVGEIQQAYLLYQYCTQPENCDGSGSVWFGNNIQLIEGDISNLNWKYKSDPDDPRDWYSCFSLNSANCPYTHLPFDINQKSEK